MQLPYEVVLVNDPVEYLGDKRMEFHLIYAGAWEKHSVRRYLHAQMKKLWDTHPALRFYASKTYDEPNGRTQKFIDRLAHTHEKSGLGFVPLLTKANGLVCSLDILFLRHDHPDQSAGGDECRGDIDNRVKTLIDALRVPSNADEMQRKIGDEADPNPTFCLMEDDRLITSLKVKTDRLLFTLDPNDKNEACLVIQVQTANVDPFGSPWELHL